MNGILNVYKEKGLHISWCSGKTKRNPETEKIGHTGTLDPDAQGFFQSVWEEPPSSVLFWQIRKTYETVLHLGIETDTQDISGQVKCRLPVEVSPKEVEECIMSFQGDQMQIPPMYSALKVDGKKAVWTGQGGKRNREETKTGNFL